jgi:hypothetical protein
MYRGPMTTALERQSTVQTAPPRRPLERQQTALVQSVRLITDRHRLAWMPNSTAAGAVAAPPEELIRDDVNAPLPASTLPQMSLPPMEDRPSFVQSITAFPSVEMVSQSAGSASSLQTPPVLVAPNTPSSYVHHSPRLQAASSPPRPEGNASSSPSVSRPELGAQSASPLGTADEKDRLVTSSDAILVPEAVSDSRPVVTLSHSSLWFAPISRLGPELLDGVYGPVCVDVRVHGRLASQCPEALDDFVDKILSGLVDGLSCLHVVAGKAATQLNIGPIEVFCWMVSSGHAFEVTPSTATSTSSSFHSNAAPGDTLGGLPPVVFLAALIASPTVRTIAVHLKPILRLIAALLGTSHRLAPRHCVDLGLVDALLKPFASAGRGSHDSSLPLMHRLAALVDGETLQIWRDDATTNMKRPRDGAADGLMAESESSLLSQKRHRGLDAVECNFRVMANAYLAALDRLDLQIASYECHSTASVMPPPRAEIQKKSAVGDGAAAGKTAPCDEKSSTATLSPIDLDIYCEWQTVCMNIRGLRVDVDSAQRALDMLKSAAEERVQRFVQLVVELCAPSAASIPALRVDDFFAGRLEPSTAWMFLGCPRPYSPATTSVNVPLHEAPSEDPMSLIEQVALLPRTDAAEDAHAVPSVIAVAAAAYMEATALTRHADEVASWVRRFAQREFPAADWRIHPTWTHKPDTTGRVFASKPNVQTLPKRVPEGGATLMNSSHHAAPGGWLPTEVLRRCMLDTMIDDDGHRNSAIDIGSSCNSQLPSLPPILRWVLRGPRGTVLVAVDYSQIELRVCAHLSNDPALLSLFPDRKISNSGSRTKDVFLGIADILFQGGAYPDVDSVPPPPSALTGDESGGDRAAAGEERLFGCRRHAAKTIVYSILYGMSNEGIADLLAAKTKGESEDARAWSALFPCDKSALDLVQRFFRRFPQVTNYLQSVCDEARRTGAVRGVLRTRFVDTPYRTQSSVVAAGPPLLPATMPAVGSMGGHVYRTRFDRSVVSVAIQGSAADVIKLAMHLVERRDAARQGVDETGAAPRAVLVSSAHDELVFAVSATEASETCEWLKQQLESVGVLLSLRVPLEAHTSVRGYLA